jgi:hypothetical protein
MPETIETIALPLTPRFYTPTIFIYQGSSKNLRCILVNRHGKPISLAGSPTLTFRVAENLGSDNTGLVINKTMTIEDEDNGCGLLTLTSPDTSIPDTGEYLGEVKISWIGGETLTTSPFTVLVKAGVVL